MRERPIVVLATGVWDLLHEGHLNILENAKGLGDKLVVGVSTDECVKKEKGKTPVESYESRIRRIKALKVVDCAIPQYTRDKTELIKKIKPDFLVAGDDWDRLTGQELLEEMGGKVVFFPYTPRISTTEMIKRIKTYQDQLDKQEEGSMQ